MSAKPVYQAQVPLARYPTKWVDGYRNQWLRHVSFQGCGDNQNQVKRDDQRVNHTTSVMQKKLTNNRNYLLLKLYLIGTKH